MTGFRLGYGGGYYDKTITYLKKKKHKFISIAIAFDDQKVKSVIHNNYDQRIDYILTEKELYKIIVHIENIIGVKIGNPPHSD